MVVLVGSNVGLRFAGLVLQIRFRVENEEKDF